MVGSSRVSGVLRGLAWFGGVLVWLTVLGALGEVAKLAPRGLAQTAAVCGILVVEAAATVLLVRKLANRTRLPRMLWIGLASFAALGIFAHLQVGLWLLFIAWFSPPDLMSEVVAKAGFHPTAPAGGSPQL